MDYRDHTFKVESRGVHQGSNTVDLKFGTSADGGHVMGCTCGFPMRHAIPCQHVLAAAKRKPLRDGYDMLREYVPASSCVELFVWVVDRYCYRLSCPFPPTSRPFSRLTNCAGAIFLLVKLVC